MIHLPTISAPQLAFLILTALAWALGAVQRMGAAMQKGGRR